MAEHPVHVDGVLKQWGDRLFYEDVKHPKGARRPYQIGRKKSQDSSSGKSSSGGAARVRHRLALTAKRIPEAMVKISKARKGIGDIKKHLNYISRNGKLSVEDQDGQRIEGREALRDFLKEWKDSGRLKETSTSRDAYSIILSMPAGTDREAVTKSAREFAKAEFGKNHRYAFARHDDKNHSHVHLCILAVGRDGTRLNPRKADLQRWREGFAEKLRDNGIEANATRRNVRGVSKKAIRQPVIHMDKRDASDVLNNQRQSVVEELTGKSQPNPHTDAMRSTRGTVRTAYHEIVNALQQSPNPEDKILATHVRSFVDSMPPQETRREEAVRIFKQTHGKNKELGQDRDVGPER